MLDHNDAIGIFVMFTTYTFAGIMLTGMVAVWAGWWAILVLPTIWGWLVWGVHSEIQRRENLEP